MAIMIWSSKYSVGVDDLDRDHLVLISLLNHMDEAKRFQTDETIIGQIMGTFVKSLFAHFRREERLLEKFRYPELSGHRKMHRSLERQLKHFLAKHERGLDPAVSEEFTNLLCLWLDDHLLKADMGYKGFLEQATDSPGGDGSS